MFNKLWFGTLTQLFLLYFVELVTLIYLLRKYKQSSFFVLIILLFYPAIISFIGKDFFNGYRIITLFFTLWLCNKRKVFVSFKKGDELITFIFVLFSVTFFYSATMNNDNWEIILSQFSRYFIAYCLWFLVRKELYFSYESVDKHKNLVFELFLMQIIISIAKLIIYSGSQIESIVGSISHNGGAAGTTIPILGFIALWFNKRGVFDKRDWLYIMGLMLIGFLAGKRAVWFIMPIVMASFMIYVPRMKMNKTLWMTIIMSPLAFYLGMRLTPTLNPENKVWGSFDYEYAFEYADKYQFGADKKRNNEAQGRGGATKSLWEKWTSKEKLTNKDWFGVGLTQMYATNYKEFDNLNLGIAMKGNATGIFQTYITIGYYGIFATILFLFSILLRIKMKRIRWVLMALVAWEYLMYQGMIFREPELMFLIIYFVHYSNFLTKMHQKPFIS